MFELVPIGQRMKFIRALFSIAAGFFGIGAALCLLLLHLAQIDSLGLNYTAPLSDGRPRPLKRLLPPSAREGTEARRTEP